MDVIFKRTINMGLSAREVDIGGSDTSSDPDIWCINYKITVDFEEESPDVETKNNKWATGRITHLQRSQLNLHRLV